MNTCLYSGKVVHVRHAPILHRLSYRVFMGLFDLDELPQLSHRSILFGYNRAGLLSFQDRDHCDGSGSPLRPQIEGALTEFGIVPPGGAIRLLCMPRMLGYLFNPISVYFCHDPAGELRAVVHEVNNTFGRRHLYVLPAHVDENGQVRQSCAKQFRVSPFLAQDLHYRFLLTPPGQRTAVLIGVDRDGVELLSAWFAGKHAPFTTASLLRQLVRHPGMTLKVIAGIHWEALVLWSKLRRFKKTGARKLGRRLSS